MVGWLDVIIPARDEEALLPRCLKALLCDGDGLRLNVIVVANGPDRASTVSAARRWEDAYSGDGHRLTVLECLEAGKARALNCGDRRRRGDLVVYMDADVVVLPGTIPALQRHLIAAPGAMLACPRPLVVRSDDFVARQFGNIWAALPTVRDGIIGGGCYAVNAAGRGRWDEFPDIAADDAFVCSRFADEERHQIPEGGFYFVFPSGPSIVAMRRRWLRASSELARFAASDRQGGVRYSRAKRSTFRSVAAVLASPAHWPSFPLFAVISLLARVPLNSPSASKLSDWRPVRPGQPCDAWTPTRGRVTAAIVTHNNEQDIARCLASITSRWADVEVRVIDNASSDNTVPIIRSLYPSLTIEMSAHNAGFGAAVNKVLASIDYENYILLVNPDAILDDGAIDALLALAARFPEAGIYAGRMRDKRGRVEPTSCLALPSLHQAIAFALGLNGPDALGGWRRSGTRTVPTLTAGLLLVSPLVWRMTEGFGEGYFLCGEDVDLNIRARSKGARPMFTEFAGYVRHGEASSASEADRMRGILGGKALLYRKHLGPGRARLARFLLLAGVGARALAELTFRPGETVWRSAWRGRSCWLHPWDVSH